MSGDQTDAGPNYLQYKHVSARLWPRQYFEIDLLAKKLQGARTDKTTRITSNTLYRVAAELLLARQGELEGNNEDELRRSLGLRTEEEIEKQERGSRQAQTGEGGPCEAGEWQTYEVRKPDGRVEP